MKKDGEKITMLTAYDYTTAKILDEAGIDILLVGDSLGMVMLGYENTLPVTLDEMLHHARAVGRGTENALLVADMPFLSYEIEAKEAVRNAGRLIKEAGAQAVKVEGGAEIAETIKALVAAKIPVMGHIGLTPQAIHQMGGYKVQGRNSEAAQKLLNDAKVLSKAGIFALVLECIPYQLAKEITGSVEVPTIGIGAGPHCDGQVLVIHDILGLYEEIRPKFVKRYRELGSQIKGAVTEFINEVREGEFPTLKESYE
ncbi:3-methyl-2-oxobutanoate hydroxymethyltransferase [bacterium]|nr:3-methyl-2-oxobutanoate hydroxymethyltransferase [bacterium]